VRNHKFHGGKKRKTRTLQKLTQAIRALETRTHKELAPYAEFVAATATFGV
jgi:predicted pyridoxine 5'-phosphate oxidase superfamily flavin-nucleotide-binding protein